MQLLRPVSGLVLVALLMCHFSLASFAQQPASTSRVDQSAPSRMRVVNAQPTFENRNQTSSAAYTIVGQVHRSGVYLTSENPLPIRKLIEAAGGLNDAAHPTLRVIRNGEIRFQVHFNPQGPGAQDLLMPGDIVVVSTSPQAAVNPKKQDEVIPVACVGLIDRPVVLPLSPSIQTVEELIRRLAQHPDLIRNTRLIAPMQGARVGQLVSGTVVIFSPEFIDRTPLLQPEVLPAPIDLDQLRTSATPDVMPVNVVMPPSVPPANSIQQVSADMIRPPMKTLTSESEFAARAETDTNLQGAPELPPQKSVASADSFEAVPPLLPPDLEYALGKFTGQREKSTSASQDEPQARILEAGAVEDETTIKVARNDSSEPARSTSQSIQTPNEFQPTESKSVSADLAAESIVSNQTEGRSTRLSRVQVWTMAGAGLALLLVGCLVVAMTLEKGRTRRENIGPVSLTAITPESPEETQAGPNPEESIIEPAHSPKATGVRDLLERSVPMIEEPINVPGMWPLHGKVVGHRRIILNSAHEGVNPPHFTRRERRPERSLASKKSMAADERKLRDSLRTICRPIEDEIHSEFALDHSEDSVKTSAPRGNVPPESSPEHRTLPPSPETTQVHNETPTSNQIDDLAAVSPADSGPTSFDIVQPEQSGNRSVMSPLERALRTLASEKRG